MGKYNYREEMKKDVRGYIKYEIIISDYRDRDKLEEHLNNILWASDVTGNSNGSYTFSTYKAQEYIMHNLELVIDAYKEFGHDSLPFSDLENPEAIDVTIRCYLLGEVIAEVLDDMESNGEFDGVFSSDIESEDENE